MNGAQTSSETALWFSPWIREFCGFGQAGAGLELLGKLQATLWRVMEWPGMAQGYKAHKPCGVLREEWLRVDPQDTGGYVPAARACRESLGALAGNFRSHGPVVSVSRGCEMVIAGRRPRGCRAITIGPVAGDLPASHPFAQPSLSSLLY